MGVFQTCHHSEPWDWPWILLNLVWGLSSFSMLQFYLHHPIQMPGLTSCARVFHALANRRICLSRKRNESTQCTCGPQTCELSQPWPHAWLAFGVEPSLAALVPRYICDPCYVAFWLLLTLACSSTEWYNALINFIDSLLADACSAKACQHLPCPASCHSSMEPRMAWFNTHRACGRW